MVARIVNKTCAERSRRLGFADLVAVVIKGVTDVVGGIQGITDMGQLVTGVVGVGKLFFSTVFFYSEGKDGYSKYQSDLPFNLSFDDDREVVLSKLGEPSWQRLAIDKERVISDRWDNLFSVPYRLHVTYSKDDRKISIVSVTIPDKPIS